MDWKWTLLIVLAAGIPILLCWFQRRPSVDEEHCPYRIGTDRADCHGRPCESEPPCRTL